MRSNSKEKEVEEDSERRVQRNVERGRLTFAGSRRIESSEFFCPLFCFQSLNVLTNGVSLSTI